ncbi:MAG TPA: sulfotransferase [Acidimicrobiales bacterium]|nr:sulfotransferase [Acidimicrobiales bacterium]
MPVKVLYIAGWGRSGTTIVANLLGQLDGFCSVGELRYLWDRGLQQGGMCGCGRPVSDCSFWGAVLEAAFGSVDGSLAADMVSIQRGHLRTRHLPLLARQLEQPGSLASRYADRLEALYGAVARCSGAQVVVDSSKFPADALVASALPSVDFHLLHVVRDPRAVAFSWSRAKLAPGDPDGVIRQRGTLYSTWRWLAWNLLSEGLGSRPPSRYLRIRYEDFVAEPGRHVDAVGQLVSAAVDPSRVLTGTQASLRPTHTVSGNPSRFATGSVPLQLDEEWRQAMPARARALATAVAAPLLCRYGYSAGPRR